jgi:hypothetical protein
MSDLHKRADPGGKLRGDVWGIHTDGSASSSCALRQLEGGPVGDAGRQGRPGPRRPAACTAARSIEQAYRTLDDLGV